MIAPTPLWKFVGKILLGALAGAAGSEVGRAAGKRIGRAICPGYDQPPAGTTGRGGRRR